MESPKAKWYIVRDCDLAPLIIQAKPIWMSEIMIVIPQSGEPTWNIIPPRSMTLQ